MAQHEVTNLSHPALRAWRKLWPRTKVARVVPIQEKPRSSVYRLEGAGPGGTDVIAKRSRHARASAECTFYEELSKDLCIPTADYYGFVQDEQEQFGWLFLRFVEAERYSPSLNEHRLLAARWLGGLHTAAVGYRTAEHLPDRGPGAYLQHLRSARRRLLHSLGNPALTTDDCRLLNKIALQCDLLEAHWPRLQELCAAVPRTMVHGDFVAKNLCVRTGGGQTTLLVFDWEHSGWGSVAVDLVQSEDSSNAYSANPQLAAYYSLVRQTWSHLGEDTVRSLANAGRIFRLLHYLDEDTQNLHSSWVEKAMERMKQYHSRFNLMVLANGWKV